MLSNHTPLYKKDEKQTSNIYSEPSYVHVLAVYYVIISYKFKKGFVGNWAIEVKKQYRTHWLQISRNPERKIFGIIYLDSLLYVLFILSVSHTLSLYVISVQQQNLWDMTWHTLFLCVFVRFLALKADEISVKCYSSSPLLCRHILVELNLYWEVTSQRLFSAHSYEDRKWKEMTGIT